MPKINAQVTNRKDFLLLLLYSPGVDEKPNEPIVGRTRIIKTVFLFREEVLKEFKKNLRIDETKFYRFFAWNYGPFSTDVIDDLDFFELRGFLQRSPSSPNSEPLPEEVEEFAKYQSQYELGGDEGVTEYEEEEFSLSSDGEKFATRLYDSLTTEQQNLLRDFKAKMNSTPLRTILRYVYQNYPDTTNNSVIKDQVLS